MNLRSLAAITLAVLAIAFISGCGKKESPPVAIPATNHAAADAPSTPPGPGSPAPLATPATPQAIAGDNMDAILADLTRELHRTMIGRRLSGSFEEFVAIRNLKVPPPPPGKKYAISKQWRVVLVDQ